MNATRFDRLTRTLADSSSRRDFVHGISIALGIAFTAVHFAGEVDAKKKHKKRKKRKKPKNNEFGCLDVGKACNGKDSKCCSSICDGKGPKKGKKDKSKCIAHNVGTCQADQDLCPEGEHFPCGNGKFSTCFRTTGNASFCGNLGKLACFDCTKDSDCEEFIGLGAACVFCVGGGCDETGEKICVLPGE